MRLTDHIQAAVMSLIVTLCIGGALVLAAPAVKQTDRPGNFYQVAGVRG
jgi:hypothetical protein